MKVIIIFILLFPFFNVNAQFKDSSVAYGVECFKHNRCKIRVSLHDKSYSKGLIKTFESLKIGLSIENNLYSLKRHKWRWTKSFKVHSRNPQDIAIILRSNRKQHFFTDTIKAYIEPSAGLVYEFPVPKTIQQCFRLLDKTLPENEIALVKTLPEDSIYNNPAFKDRADFFHAWKIYEGSRLTRYFNKKGLRGSIEIYLTILISYHRYLNNEAINLEEQIKQYQLRQRKDYEIYLSKIQKDTLSGIYIPKNLQDCFIELDKLLSENDKSEIKNVKNRNETIQYHHGLGTWIRNNWGLWGGSRLQKYFLEKKLNTRMLCPL